MHLFKKSILLISLFSLVFTAEKVAVMAEGNTNDGRNCAEGQTADCNGDCFDSQTLESFIGDGFCDDVSVDSIRECLTDTKVFGRAFTSVEIVERRAK